VKLKHGFPKHGFHVIDMRLVQGYIDDYILEIDNHFQATSKYFC